MQVAWREDKYTSTASIGACFITISHPSWYDPAPVFRVGITLKAEPGTDPEWHWFEILAADTDLHAVKRGAIEQARELGCRRQRRRHEYDEEWLAMLADVILEDIQRGYARYEQDRVAAREYGYRPRPIDEIALSTGYFVGLFNPKEAGHYLGRGKSLDEIRRAVNVVLGRLERQKLIEALSLDRVRYWIPYGA